MIYSIALSKASDWLAVSSDKGTVHVFAIADNVHTTATTAKPREPSPADASPQRHNPTSMFSMVKVRSPPTCQHALGCLCWPGTNRGWYWWGMVGHARAAPLCRRHTLAGLNTCQRLPACRHQQC
jgi:hypothetical protein